MLANDDETRRGEPLDAHAILLAAATFWEHLQRAGLRMVPQSNDSAVADWKSRISRPSTPAEDAAFSPKPGQSKTPTTTSTSGQTAKPATIELAANQRLSPVPAFTSVADAYPRPPLPITQRHQQLQAMAQTVAGCTRCPILSQCRTKTVFGAGSPSARFVFFGEGPGAEEDKTGLPFVGRSGQLLTKMIEACRLQRDEVYILNTVKCRPPENRNPEETEIANCREYFEKQLEIIQPEYIVCLGAISAKAMLNTKLSIGRLRQQFHRYRDSKVIVIYHPSYLLRAPDAKKAAWADLQMLMKDANL